MKKYISTIPFILLMYISCGQTPWYSNYSFSNKILEKLSSDTLNYQVAQELSYIGEYEKMLSVWDREERKWQDELTPNQVKQFLKFKTINAKDLIVEKAKTEQIIIINEAHQQPYHRVFTTTLLHDLYKKGFRYFSAETIINYDVFISACLSFIF